MATYPAMGSQLNRDSQAGTASTKESSDAAMDSGYLSQAPSTSGTPNTTPSSKAVGIKQEGISRGAAIPFFLPGLKKRRATTVVPILGREIDEATRSRFEAIQPSFERLLLEHMRSSAKHGTTYKPMSTRLVMMGVPGQDASPYIVVFCQSEHKDTVRRFVKQGIVKDLCGVGEVGVQSFKVAVIGTAPRLRTAISVTADASRLRDKSSQTLCGTPIRLGHPSGLQTIATFGGVVKLLMSNGEIRLYGLTARHVITDVGDESTTCPSSSHPVQQPGDDVKVEPEDRDSTNLADDTDDEDSDAYLDLSPSCEQLGRDPKSPSQPWTFVNATELGFTIQPSTFRYRNVEPTRQDYDWVLFETDLYELNRLPSDTKARVCLTQRRPGRTGSRAVYMISASAGVQRGQLLSEAGRIIIGSGEEFVDAYMVTFSSSSGICDGDSGSWVVDCNTFELYGHLVASDMFNGGYVMPIVQVFEDIKQHFGATSVELPNEVDILHARTVRLPGQPASKEDEKLLNAHDHSIREHTPPFRSLGARENTSRMKRSWDSGYGSGLHSLDGSPQKRLRKSSPEHDDDPDREDPSTWLADFSAP